MGKRYNVYNKYGVKVGEVRETYGEEWTVLVLLLIGVGVIIAPPWFAYQMGKGTLSRYGCFTIAITGFLTIVWLFSGIAIATMSGSPLSAGDHILQLLFIFGLPLLGYIVGVKARDELSLSSAPQVNVGTDEISGPPLD